VTSAPYAATRAATAGPDVVAAVQQGGRVPPELTSLEHAPGVVDSSGPYLIATPSLVVDGHADPVMAEGRPAAGSSVDQPKLTAGHWVSNGGVVIERSLADLLNLKVGDRVGLDALVGGGNGPGGGPVPGVHAGDQGPGGGTTPCSRPLLQRSSGSPSPRRSSLHRSVRTLIRRGFPKRASSG
jgi:hypothetical protein